MIAPTRIAAYEILSAVSAGNADLPTAIALARASLNDERDRALAAEIAAGVQRRRAALDHLIVEFAKRPRDLPLPPRPADPRDRDAVLAYFSTTLSHPRWLAARWYDRLGFEAAERWLMFNNEAAPVTLRANRLRVTARELADRLAGDDVRVTPARFATDALLVEDGHPLRGRGLDEGWFVVQDEASQLVAALADAGSHARVLDACASPGGKATAMASAMNGRGLLVACDVRGRRMELLRKTVAASGATNVRLVQADLLKPLPFSSPFDLEIVDAPCSGLGTLRRDPDIRWRRRESDLAPLAAAQLTMLQHAAGAVAPRGRLVYATCSSEPEENEGVVDAFLAAARDFEPLDARDASPLVPRAVVDSRGHLRTEPHTHGLEAFLGTVVVRSGIRW